MGPKPDLGRTCDATIDPTKRTYATLQAAVRHFNRALFGSRLPPCLITFQRRANALGEGQRDRAQS